MARSATSLHKTKELAKKEAKRVRSLGYKVRIRKVK